MKIVGLPAGSLADPKRGGSLTNLLHGAGFPSKGYDRGGPSSFPVTPFLVGWDGRPQEFGAQLSIGEIDVAIGGDDWVRERSLEFKYEYNSDIELQKVLPLQRGSVRIVIIGRPGTDGATPDCDAWLTALLQEKKLVTMVAEMPYIAIDWFKRKKAELGFADSHNGHSVQNFITPSRIDEGLVPVRVDNDERPDINDRYNLLPFQYGVTARFGYRFLEFYSNYALSPLFEPDIAFNAHSFQIGLRLITI